MGKMIYFFKIFDEMEGETSKTTKTSKTSKTRQIS